MLKYQIRFCDSKGNGSFRYVESKTKKGIENKAAQVATDYLKEHYERQRFRMFTPPAKPKRVVHVWEWDTEKKEVKRNGHRFKLELRYIQATFLNGNKRREEWYEPVINS
jgi:hypothetical protein